MPRLSSFPGLLLTCVAVAATLAGCATPQPQPAPGERISTDDLLKLPAAAADYARTEWLPRFGRMGEAARNRHFRPDRAESLLWVAEFERSDALLPPEWKAVGSPILKPFRLDGLNGIEVAAVGENSGECVIERPINPEQLHTRDVRLSLQIACPSPRRLQNLRTVRLSIVSTDPAGRLEELSLPLTMDLSPGWETLSWWMRFGPHVGPTSLRLHFLNGGAAIVIRRIQMNARDWLPESALSPATAPASRPATASVNLISGGDFETGRRQFFTSLLRRWPNEDQTPSPLPFEYDNEAVVGERSLRLRLTGGTGRLGFGPLDLNRFRSGPQGASSAYLKLYAKTSRATAVTAKLRTRDRSLDQTTFTFGSQWQPVSSVFKFTADSPAQIADLSSAELLIDIPSDSPEPLECWIDAVSLTDAPVDTYVQAEPIEVGITGPAPLTADLANIVSEDETTLFSVDLVSARPPETPVPGTGKLALDLLDAWDRTVWTRTADVVMPRGGKYSEKVSLRIPCGYYRLFATLWNGEPGQSRLISRDSQAVAVVSFKDPVPLGNRYGLTAPADAVSAYTTALGAGWVRINFAAPNVEAKSGAWDFGMWQPALTAARQASVELVAAVGLPTIERYRRTFIEQLLANIPLQPIGMVVSPPAISTRPGEEYREQLEWVGQVLSSASPHCRVVFDVSALNPDGVESKPDPLPDVPNLVVGYASTDGLLPEHSEPLLEKIGQRYAGQIRVWDLGVPVALGGNGTDPTWTDPPPAGTEIRPVARLEPPLDPALSASRMIRSVLIRALAGAQLVCLEATALDPLASIYEPDSERLHESDLTPRPALVAFERMTSLLNDATLVRWIDQPDGCRILYFEKDDGGAVAALWRPFGLSPTYLSFAGLPSTMQVVDCFGGPEPLLMSGNLRIIPANEMVRYIVAPPGQAALLAEAVESSRLRNVSPQTQPER